MTWRSSPQRWQYVGMRDTPSKALPNIQRPRDTSSEAEGINILLVEDRVQDRFLVKKLLRKQAPENQVINVLEADSLLEGIEVLRRSEQVIHCILLDLNLPDGRGLEVLLRIKNINRQVPIIIVTGLEDPATLEAAVRFGAHSFIMKKDVARLINIWKPVFEAILSGAGASSAQLHGPHRECDFALDKKLNIASWDESCALLTGWPPNEVLGKPLESLTVKGFRKEVHQALLDPNAHLDETIEFDLINQAGEVVRLELSAVANEEKDGSEQHWRLSQPSDEVVNAMASQIVNAVVKLSGELLLIVDIDGKIHRCSETAETLLGDPQREIIGASIQQLTDISSAKDARDMLLAMRRGFAFAADRYAVVSHSQTVVFFRINATPLRDEFGGLIGACILGQPLPDTAISG